MESVNNSELEPGAVITILSDRWVACMNQIGLNPTDNFSVPASVVLAGEGKRIILEKPTMSRVFKGFTNHKTLGPVNLVIADYHDGPVTNRLMVRGNQAPELLAAISEGLLDEPTVTLSELLGWCQTFELEQTASSEA